MSNEKKKIHYILSNAILRNKKEGWIILHQEKYLTNNLNEFNILNTIH